MKAFSSGRHAVAAVCRQKGVGYSGVRRLQRWSSTSVQPPTSIMGNASTPKSQNISMILSKPMWSARSLLPGKSKSSEEKISSKQLHHLLRLSALPLPKSPEEERRMIDVLQSQLHFVRDIQAVDTANLAPLRSIRDETAEGLREVAVGIEQVSAALSEEAMIGHSRRPRRQRKSENAKIDNWDILSTASRKAGKYFIVKSGKE